MIYAANPNLIYMQATAMSESSPRVLSGACLFHRIVKVLAEVFIKCGSNPAAACLIRYDG